MENIQKHIANLREYCKYDKQIMNYNENELSDFEKFCKNHIEDIEAVIDAYEKLDQKFRYAVPDDMIKELYISKDKIREKIKVLEKIKKEEEKTKSILIYSFYDTIINEIDGLEELLEE